MVKKQPKTIISMRMEPKLIRLLDKQRALAPKGITRTRLIEDAVRLYLAALNPESTQQKSA
jgi:hypothetical protein